MEKHSGRSLEEIEKRRRAKIPSENPRTTERKLREAEAAAETDPLTELLNRRGFTERLQRKYDALMYERRDKDHGPRSIVIAILDIDFFKKVNDTYGHDAGDEVLKQVARYLRDNVRAEDVVARWGGEEIILALSNGPDLPATMIAEELRAGIEKLPIEWEGKRINITVSIGVADEDASKTFDGAIRAADEALYDAKHEGRNRVISSSSRLEQMAA